MDERKLISINTIIQNTEENIKKELGAEYTCFLPVLIVSVNEILIKLPIFKISTDTYEFTHIYSVAMITGEVKQKESLYDSRKINDINSIKRINYSKIYEILLDFEKSYMNYEFDNDLYLDYYKELSMQLSEELKILYRELIDDKQVVDNYFADKFEFDWTPEDGLKYIPEEIFQIAEKLVEANAIEVLKKLDKNGFMQIYSSYSCDFYRNLKKEGSVEELLKEQVPPKRTVLSRLPNTNLVQLCNTYNCRLDACLYLVAGYIYYLRTSKQEDKIRKDREFYKNNELLICSEVKKKRKEQLKAIKQEENKKIKELEKYREKISNIDILLENLQSEGSNGLYCIIEGERGLGQSDLVNKIAEVLKISHKIFDSTDSDKQDPAVIEMSLQNLYSDLTRANQTSMITYNLFKKNKLYVINGIDEFINDYKTFKDVAGISPHDELRKKQIKHMLGLLGRIEDENYVIILGENKHIKNFLELDIRIKNLYQECHLVLQNLSLDEIYEEYKKNIKPYILNLLKSDEENFKRTFINFITLNKRALPFDNFELAEYLALYSNSKNKLILPDNIYKKETVEESLKNIIGLDKVKNKLKDFEKYMIFTNQAIANGLDIMSSNMHMIFTGNPGSGKTTIARIMAKMLFDMGILKENKLIEVDRKDLVGQYIGQTAPKTGEVIEKAMGGVLFIDEAYALTPEDSARDFGQEAIATLIKAMEDKKGEIVVIFAGYKNEMKTFVDSNPGIASRIGYTFDFPDYSAEELFDIYNVKITNMGFNLSLEANDEVKSLMQYFCNVENIGNGRFVDKVLQETLIKHSRNGYIDIKNIVEEDIPTVQEVIDVVFNKATMINPEDVTEESKKKTAIHEVGHAVVRMLLFDKPGIKKITINVEGTGTLGYVSLEEKGVLTQSKSELLKRINIALAGMAAEEVYLGEFENGNSSDLKQATNISKHMITEAGMSSLGLGQITEVSGEMAKLVQEEINSMLDKCYYETKKIIQENKSKIDKVIEYLLEHGEITEEDLINQYNS